MNRKLIKLGSAVVLFTIAVAALLGSMVVYAGTPLLGSDCGSTATIVGTDAAGKITLGIPDPETAATGVCTLRFGVAYTNPPACAAAVPRASGAGWCAEGVGGSPGAHRPGAGSPRSGC